MNASELREKSDAELQEELLDSSGELFKLRMKKANLKENDQFKKARRNIARVKTIQTERKNAKAKGE